MRIPNLRMLAPLLAVSLTAQMPEVKERRLANGFQVLLVERPGAGAVHARLVLRGGRADTGALPAAAAELLARTLFRRLLPEEVAPGNGFEALLKQEEGVFEALRLEQIRRVRRSNLEGSAEELALRQLHGKHLAELGSKLEASAASDPLEALGATRRQASSGADEIAFSLDLPKGAFESWCRLEPRHLQRMSLFHFPLERARLIQELQKGNYEGEGALSILLGTAFSGHPYAQTFDLQRGSLEGLTWSELRAFGRSLTSPDRMSLVLVGDLRMEAILPILQESFGALAVNAEGSGRREDHPIELADAPGFRRLQASIGGDPCVFLAWRIPPANHPDAPALRLLAQILGGAKGSRLIRRIQDERGLARSLSVQTGVPGGRDPSLFLIEARPAEGRGLVELEEAIHGEILRIQRELFPEEDLRRAQRQVDAELLMAQEDAATLAKVLGSAVAQSGDWRQAFGGRSQGRSLSQDELQAVARKYLVPGQEISALLEADPLLAPRDLVEERLGKVLTLLVERKLDDLAQAESVVRETLRQLRMLSLSEREQTLKLLEAQTGS